MFRFIVIVVLYLFPVFTWGNERIPGDINGDGQVNFADFVTLSRNFGRTDGAVFDPGAGPDTVTVTVIDTLWQVTEIPVPVSEPPPTIHIMPGDWASSAQQLQTVFDEAMRLSGQMVLYPVDSPIQVHYTDRPNPHILYERAAQGEYVVRISDNGIASHNLSQFSHEYGHILTNYYQNAEQRHKWFDEAMASMVSLKIMAEYTVSASWSNDQDKRAALLGLRQFILDIKNANPLGFTGGKDVGHAHSGLKGGAGVVDRVAFRAAFQQLDQSPNAAWKKDTSYTHYYWIAANLFDVFWRTDGWNALRYLNMRGPLVWDASRESFAQYLRGWYLRTPPRWQGYVTEVAWRLGY